MWKVVFVCIHNSARSQMAEAFLQHLGGERFQVHSAGLEPGALNPNAVQVMQEIGIDMSKNRTKSVDELLQKAITFDYVITVCDAASAERCPVFPAAFQKIAWSFADPSALQGTPTAILEQTRKIRDAIQEKVIDFIAQVHQLKIHQP